MLKKEAVLGRIVRCLFTRPKSRDRGLRASLFSHKKDGRLSFAKSRKAGQAAHSFDTGNTCKTAKLMSRGT